jgi:hypothetical protein
VQVSAQAALGAIPEQLWSVAHGDVAVTVKQPSASTAQVATV